MYSTSSIVEVRNEGWAGPAAAARRWHEAEARLYAGLVTVPDLLEAAVELVGRLAAELRAVTADLASLHQMSEERDGLRAEAGCGPSLEALPIDTLIDAACAIRYRELRAEAARAERRDALRQAEADGATWLELPRGPAVDLAGTSAGGATGVGGRLLVHLPSGRGVVAAVEQDPETGGTVFVSRAATVDVVTGRLGPPSEGLRGEWRATAWEDHERQLAALRQHIESSNDPVARGRHLDGETTSVSDSG